jgi:DNA-binding NarL/FixJ family response regulator
MADARGTRHFGPREGQVAQLVAEGLADKEIAARLGISVRTIRTHLERLFRRHNLQSRAALSSLWVRTSRSPLGGDTHVDTHVDSDAGPGTGG